MRKKVSLLAALGITGLLTAICLSSCGETEGYTVRVLLTEAEGYTITGENPVTIPAGSDAVFQVQLEEGYNFVQASSGTQADIGGIWADGTLTIPAVWYPTTVNLIATDADEKVKFFVDNDTGGGVVSMGTDEYFFYPGAQVILTAEPHEGNYFAGWTLDKSMDKGGRLLSTDSTFAYEITERAEVFGNFYPVVVAEEETAPASTAADNLSGPTQNYGSWGIQGNESTHMIEYKANGGTVSGYDSDTYYDQVSTAVYSCPNTLADKNIFVREGYVLLEYNTKADGSGTAIPCGGKFPPDGEMTTLYCIWAAYADAADFRYEDNGHGMTITGYNGDDELLVIPERVGSKAVTRIAAGAFKNRSFTTLVIPKTVEVVEDGAFQHCIQMETLYLFDSIKSISDNAFSSRENWKHLRLGAVKDPTFSNHEDATFCRKWEKLLTDSLTDTKNLVVCSGSSSYYGLDTPLLEELLGGEYSVINFGNVATCSVSFFMDGVADYLDSEDILVQAPETAYGGEMGDPYFFWVIYRIIEHSYDFLYRVDDIGLYHNVLNALTEYNGYREYMTPLDYDIFCTTVDENGDITLDMPNGPEDAYFGVPISFWQINGDWLQNLNLIHDRIMEETGCRIYFSFAPFNYNAVAADSRDTETHDILDNMLKETLHVPVISYVWDYMLEGRLMYNSDYHPAEEGRGIRTRQLAKDILAQFAKEAES
ncbi:MAG: leucine-rich repeat protein [Clostridia bacterium]|nr:leucine-rich repeat protein [Clostridia bacterium]